ncbi:hypothetical protein [Pedobacter sp. JCM 36344]|uniref:hypothetical protein n=1 Tax=Pedobacter sp. JCM 36344 TaxID=3374280 RepID=UPI0039785126
MDLNFRNPSRTFAAYGTALTPFHPTGSRFGVYGNVASCFALGVDFRIRRRVTNNVSLKPQSL